MRNKKKVQALRILGVMTGTSCDGLDAACVEIHESGWQVLWEKSLSYPVVLKKRVLSFQSQGSVHSSKSWLELNRDLGLWYGKALRKLIQSESKRPDVIANHGQTLAHFPSRGNKGTTLQMGDGTRIATATGLTVVTSFREGDMSAGGQGAPLVPLFHSLLVKNDQALHAGVAIHNIGGISNLTYLGPHNTIMAFDTGPGNLWIDSAVEVVSRGKMKFDQDGKIALQGQVDFHVVRKILKHPFFKKAPPKSTGRDEFQIDALIKLTRDRSASLVSTATFLTIESIANAYEKWIIGNGMPLQSIFLCGGGAKNKAIVEGLKSRLPEIYISTLEEVGINPQFVEAEAFALFGFFSLLGRPIGGEWTGVKQFGPPGHIIPGENWSLVFRKMSRFMGA